MLHWCVAMRCTIITHVALDLGPRVYSGDMGQRREGCAKIMEEKRHFQISKPMTSEASEFEASLLYSNRWLTNTMPIFPVPLCPVLNERVLSFTLQMARQGLGCSSLCSHCLETCLASQSLPPKTD